MPTISIIIPVYKVEQYIRECLDSILNQTYTDWEVLLIDDGSPDNSGAICDEYAAKDNRFRVFHKQNGGVSSARNFGIVKAQGDYITFVDSDDMLLPNALEICMRVMTEYKLDLLQFGFTRSWNTLPDSPKQCGVVLNSHEFFKTRHNVCVGGGVIRHNILTANNLLFEEGMKLAEDQLFMLHVIRNSKRLMKIDDKLYYYRDNADSATHHSKIDDLTYSCNVLIPEKHKYPEFALVLDNTILMFVLSILNRVNDKKSTKDILRVYRSADINYCHQTYKAGRMFFYLSKINTQLACDIFRVYMKVKARN